MLQSLRLHGLGQLAQLNSENLCARSGHRPWFAGIPTAAGGAQKAIVTFGDCLQLN